MDGKVAVTQWRLHGLRVERFTVRPGSFCIRRISLLLGVVFVERGAIDIDV